MLNTCYLDGMSGCVGEPCVGIRMGHVVHLSYVGVSNASVRLLCKMQAWEAHPRRLVGGELRRSRVSQALGSPGPAGSQGRADPRP